MTLAQYIKNLRGLEQNMQIPIHSIVRALENLEPDPGTIRSIARKPEYTPGSYPREAEIIALRRAGMKNHEIAAAVGISTSYASKITQTLKKLQKL